MGVVHSMDEEQVHRVSHALRDSASAIQGINDKFDNVDRHWAKMNEHQQLVTDRIDETLESFALMEDTFNHRIETVLKVVNYATDELTVALEGTLILLSRLDLRKKQTEMPKIIIPLALPLIVLLIELAVANAYLGILLASLPEVRDKYSKFLVGNASSVLIGLSVSLIWLGGYRLWLSRKSRYVNEGSKAIKQRFDQLAQSAGMRQAKADAGTDDSSEGVLPKASSMDSLDESSLSVGEESVNATTYDDATERYVPSSVVPRYQTRNPLNLVSKRNEARAFGPTVSFTTDEDDRVTRKISMGDSASSSRRNDALRSLMEKRAERGATSHDRIKDRLATLDLDQESSLLAGGRIRRLSEARLQGAELEEQVVNLRLRRTSMRVQSPTAFEHQQSVKEPRRRSSKVMETCTSDAHSRGDSSSQKPSGGKLKPQVVKTDLGFFNPLNTEVRWTKQPAINRSDRPQERANNQPETAPDRDASAPATSRTNDLDLQELSDEVSARFREGAV